MNMWQPVKHILRLMMLLGAIPLLASADAHAESQPMPPASTIQADFPASWMEQMIQAYEDFKTSHDDLSCFKVRAWREGDSYFVSIESKRGVEVKDGKINIPVGGATPCGYGANYEFDNTGRLVKSTGIR